MRVSLFALALLCSTPALAQPDAADSWITTVDTVRARAAGIALPQQPGPLALVKTGEISDYGTGINSYAQYASADNVVQAAAFIYRPGFADTAIASLGTERAIIERFGPDTHRAAQSVTAAGGHPGVALRTLYKGAAEGQLVLTSAFIHIGGWIVKLRVTATSDRLSDVEASMDAMLKGLSFDNPSALHQASLVQINDCVPSTQGRADTATAFPRDGADALCRDGTVKVGDAHFDMLRSASAGSNGPVLIPTDDAAGLLRFDRMADGSGYKLTRYGIGSSVAGEYFDALPSNSQIAVLIDGIKANIRPTDAQTLRQDVSSR